MGFNRRLAFGALSTAAVAGGLATTLICGGVNASPVVAPNSAQVTADQNTAESLEGAFMKVADSVGPATVYITAKMDAPSNGVMISPFGFGGGDDSPLGDLFGPSSPFQRRGGGAPQSRTITSSGSGVIVRPDGYILTNDHVVQGAKNGEVSVRLSDGTTFNHCKVFRDQLSDLAVVKVPVTKPLPYVTFADSGKLHVGQWAVAIGAPFGEENSMTAGIVSALNRKTVIGQGGDQRYYPTLIQTDASINPGNSGGPLLNIHGQLIGINVAIESPSGTSAGIGFAIPSDTAKSIMEQLITKGAVTRAELGVAPQDIPVNLRGKVGLEQGAYVVEVMAGTPADKAGIQPGDVITKIGDKTITNEVTLRDTVSSTPPGTSVPIVLVRNGKSMTVNATLNSRDKQTAQAPAQAPQRRPANDLGFEPRTLTAELASQFPLEPSSKGAVVMSVTPGSPASDAELVQGEVITAVNGAAVTTVADLNAAIARAKSGDVVTLTVLRYDQNGNKWDRAVVNITIP